MKLRADVWAAIIFTSLGWWLQDFTTQAECREAYEKSIPVGAMMDPDECTEKIPLWKVVYIQQNVKTVVFYEAQTRTARAGR
jgi:hypothetical protein